MQAMKATYRDIMERSSELVAAICFGLVLVAVAGACSVLAFGCVGPAWAYDTPTPFSGGSTSVNIKTMEHDVTLDPGEGTGTASTTTYKDGDVLSAPQCTFTHATKGFYYWTLDAGGTTMAIYPGDDVLIYEDLTLYAQYSDSTPPQKVEVPASGLEGGGTEGAAVALLLCGCVCLGAAIARRGERGEPL